MQINEIILVVLGSALIVFILYEQIKLIYNRYLRSYDKEIGKYLNRKGLQIIESRYPNNIDWKGSPFKKPAKVKVSLVMVQVNGSLITWTKTDYSVIVAVDKKSNKRLIWLEVVTSYFAKPEITIKEGQIIKDKKAKINYIKVVDKCPACNCKFGPDTKICPDCGLYFE